MRLIRIGRRICHGRIVDSRVNNVMASYCTPVAICWLVGIYCLEWLQVILQYYGVLVVLQACGHASY
jgi:hypothetical protein